jgi:hypothetical protein
MNYCHMIHNTMYNIKLFIYSFSKQFNKYRMKLMNSIDTIIGYNTTQWLSVYLRHLQTFRHFSFDQFVYDQQFFLSLVFFCGLFSFDLFFTYQIDFVISVQST